MKTITSPVKDQPTISGKQARDSNNYGNKAIKLCIILLDSGYDIDSVFTRDGEQSLFPIKHLETHLVNYEHRQLQNLPMGIQRTQVSNFKTIWITPDMEEYISSDR